MEARRNATCEPDSNLSWQGVVHDRCEFLDRNAGSEVDVGALSSGVNSRIGASGADHRWRIDSEHMSQSHLELSLNRSVVRLALPPSEWSAEIRHRELHPLDHRRYPLRDRIARKGDRSMILASLVAAAVLAGEVQVPSEISYFPGEYFDQRVRNRIQMDVLKYGDGSTALLRIWESETLTENERITILIGSAVYHDPALLPIYLDAIRSPSQRLRQAAISGYYDLLGDRIPSVNQVISDEVTRLVGREMRSARWTLRRNSLAAFWLSAVLANDEQTLPGYRGIVLNRSSNNAVRSLGRVVTPEDVDLLVAAYPLLKRSKGTIARMIEGLMLKNWTPRRERGPRGAWSASARGDATIRNADSWVEGRCATVDIAAELRRSFSALGVNRVHPYSRWACPVWFGVLNEDKEEWWPTAAHFLYRCLDPPSTLMDGIDSSERLDEGRNNLIKKINRAKTYQRRDASSQRGSDRRQRE